MAATSHTASDADRAFRDDFEACRFPAPQFKHREHVRLAYVYLCEGDDEDATARMREALRAFVRHNGVDPTKYHETLTRAWILAVCHFMARTAPSDSADAFIAQNPVLLDTTIMLTHYSADLLYSDEARARFVEPDLDAIPRHAR